MNSYYTPLKLVIIERVIFNRSIEQTALIGIILHNAHISKCES